jgi:DNA repair exonuclease SbcCD nuclease subunit
LSFSVLHTSDLHIGKAFAGFDSDKAAELRASRLGVVGRLAEAARQGNARHILVAGDFFDNHGLPDGLVRSALARMGDAADLFWHVIPGNHDAATAGGVWERAQRIGIPANVVLHIEPRPAELAPGTVLLPSPLGARALTGDPTAWMDGVTTAPETLRIGLAHGSTQGFGSERAASILIDAERCRHAGLAYLALGDWHGTKEVGPAAWYSGTPEPDQFADNDPGGALVVTFGSGGTPTVRRVETAARIWLQRRVTCRTGDDLDGVMRDVQGLGGRSHDTLLNLQLGGTVSLAARAKLDRTLEDLAGRLFVLRVKDELAVTTDAADLGVLEDRQLRRAAELLRAIADDATHPKQATATLALRELYDLAARGGARP